MRSVLFSSKFFVTAQAAEVVDMPVLVLSTGVLATQYQLITSCTARLNLLSMVSTTVHLPISIVIEVDEVNEEFATLGASEAGRVPVRVGACPLCFHYHLPRLYGNIALLAFPEGVVFFLLSLDFSLPHTLLLPHLEEDFHLLLFLLRQLVAVEYVHIVGWQLSNQLFLVVLLTRGTPHGSFVWW